MSSFYLILLSRGDNWTAERTTDLEELQQAHSAYLSRLHDDYRAVAGPLEYGPGDLSGMTLIPAEELSLDEVMKLIENDPAVKAGRLRVDIVKWHTPPGFVVVG